MFENKARKPIFTKSQFLGIAESAVLLPIGYLAEHHLVSSPLTHALFQGRISDVIIAAEVYAGCRIGGSDNKLVNAGIALSLAFTAELAQKVHLLNGTYDSGDFIAYGIGVLGIVLIEQGISKFSTY